MKSKIKKLEGTGREFNISMPAPMVEEAIDKVLGEIKKTANVPGFRQGKAPLDMIRKKHLDEALEEAKNRLIPQAYQEALEKHEIFPASYPEITDIKVDVSGDLCFKATVDAYPEVDIKNYTGVSVTANKVGVEDHEIEKALERIKGMFSEFKDKEGILEEGEFAISDVVTFIDGEPISEKRQDMWIEVSEENSLLGIGGKLKGLTRGDIKEVEAVLPENYPDKKYAGKTAVFKIEIKELKQRILPELDDELASKMGKNTASELREEVKNQLLEKKQENENINMKNQILEELIRKNRFELPGTMVAKQLKVLMEKASGTLLEKGLSPDEVEGHKEKIEPELVKEAENKVRVYFILADIAEKEDIQVSSEEIDAWLAELARSYDKPFEDVKRYYAEKDLIGGLCEQLKEGKTLNFLLERAEIKLK